MKKIIYILAAVLVALSLTVGVAAEDITTEIPLETTEIPVETDTETVAETDTETATEPTDELAELLGASTPEQVEIVKKYLLYGLQTLPFSEKTKIAMLDHLNEIAWCLTALAFVVMGLIYVRSNKKSGDNNKIMADNATALYEEGTERSETAAARIEEAETRITNITTAAFSAIKEAGQTADKTLNETAEKLVQMVKESNAEAAKIMAEAASKETAITEAVLTMGDLIVRLVNDSDIPEADRDAYTRIYNTAIERIKEVTGDDRTED